MIKLLEKVNVVRLNVKSCSTNRLTNFWLMLLPCLILIFLFRFKPLYGYLLAFRDYDIMLSMEASPWVGLANFKTMLSDPFFVRVFRNMLILAVYTVVISFPWSIIFALMLNEVSNKRFKKITQSISYLPYFIAIVVVVGFMFEILSPTGMVNNFFRAVGLPVIAFMNEPGYFRLLYIGSYIWQGMGWGSIIYLAVLSNIHQNLYEAAEIDGATRIQKIIHVSIPALAPVISIVFILSMGTVVNNLSSVGFEKVLLMQTPLNYETSDILPTYVYRRGIQSRDYSYATAVNLFESLVAFILVISTNTVAKFLKSETLY